MTSSFALRVVLFLLSLSASLVSGQNYAASFPGGSLGNVSNVLLPPFNLTSLPFTVEAWIMMSGQTADYGSVFFSRGQSPNITGLFIRNNSVASVPYELRSVVTNVDSTFDTAISVSLNTWHHVALVVNATFQTIYLDQTVFSYPTVNESVVSFNVPAYLGWDPAVTTRTFAGLMDEVRVWSVQKTLADFNAASYAPLTGNQTGLVAYYNFNSNNPTVATDSSPNGFNGVLNGVTYVASTVFAQPSGSSGAAAGASSASASSAAAASSTGAATGNSSVVASSSAAARASSTSAPVASAVSASSAASAAATSAPAASSPATSTPAAATSARTASSSPTAPATVAATSAPTPTSAPAVTPTSAAAAATSTPTPSPTSAGSSAGGGGGVSITSTTPGSVPGNAAAASATAGGMVVCAVALAVAALAL